MKAGELPPGEPDQEVLAIIFSGTEFLHYSISWTGGVKIGDLYLAVVKNENNLYEIHAKVTDYGMFKLFYPVDDTFVTYVMGKRKLPYRYEVQQEEGRGSKNRRLTLYDQHNLRILYKKNEEPGLAFDVTGMVHNEFSSFYSTRSMNLEPGSSFMVPTFADEKRNEVTVHVKDKKRIASIFGEVQTVLVMPLMKFKGLYDKDGDTVIWFTDDKCRVPVQINSKILIGSLTATLVEYRNPACSLY